MVFGDEDKILVKNCVWLKGYKATELMNKFPNKLWTKSSIKKLLKKLGPAQSTDSQLTAEHELPH